MPGTRPMSLFCALFAVLAASGAVASVKTNPVLSSYYIDGNDMTLVKHLNERFDIERRHGNGFEVIVKASEAGKLLELAPQAKLLEKNIHDVFTRLDRSEPNWRDGYHNFDSVQSELQGLASTHSDLASVESYGTSEDGRPLTVLRLTGKAGPANKPEVMITSSTHGDEVTTVEVTMGLIQKLVQGYGTDARLTKMLDNHVVYFIPVVCPDGYVNQTRYTNGVDPNRNYPFPGEPNRTPNQALANEIAWVAGHKIVGSIDMHSNLATVMYPWAYTSERPDAADLPRFQAITHQLAQDTGYNEGQIADVFGIAQGSSADFWYWKHKTLALGYEISGPVVAPTSELPELIDQNTESIWHFIENF